jgi:Na+/proline symporter
VSAIVLVFYVSAGGMYGVAYADTFQGLIMFLFVVVAPIYLLTKIGNGNMFSGFSTVMANLPAEHLSVTNEDSNRIMGWILVMSVGNLLRPELFGRIFAARSPKEGVLTWIIVTNITFLVIMVVVLLGLITKYLLPDFKGTADQYGPAMFKMIAPVWLTILYVLGVIAAAISTASSSMLGSASHYITDFHLPIFYKNTLPSAKRTLLLSRFAIAFFTGLALWWAISWKDIITIFQFGYTVLVGGLLVPFAGMFFWPRMTSAAAKWSAILGGGTTLIWKFILQDFKLIPISWLSRLDPSVPALILSIGVAIIITYNTEPEYEKVYKFAKAYDLKKMVLWAEAGMAKK